MKLPPYRYSPITERTPIEYPEGKRSAFYIGLNIEHFHLGRPSTSATAVTAGLPVDPLNFGWRDYGTRVGIWRMIELLDELELPGSVLLNAEVCEQYPQIVAAGVKRGWAWLGHGFTNSSLWTGLEPEEERRMLTQIRDTISEATGAAPRGWLGPALTETENTLPLLAELGFTHSLDWVADDQPFPLDVDGHRFISVPYSVEINDIPAFLDRNMSAAEFGQAIVDHVDLLRAESARRPGAVLGCALHPFLINQPSRHRYLVEALERIRGYEDVWFTTTDEIAGWYLDNYYDDAVATLARDTVEVER
jgi:peptidoglycan/xylan/chitin deacetylase (PgdA/CDA1 family)